MDMNEGIPTEGNYISNLQWTERVRPIRRCGVLLKEYLFDRQGILMLDGDGVFFRSDCLEYPQYTTLDILEAHTRLEHLGGRIGLATARSEHAVRYLRNHGLRLDGPLILEGGHVVIIKGIKTILASDRYMAFISSMREEIQGERYFRDSWNEVRYLPQVESGDIAICHGNFQWNGDCRATLWYSWQEEEKLGEADHAVKRIIIPRILDIASAHGLSTDDVDVRLTRMDNGLGIIRIAAKIDGRVVSKEMAAGHIWNGFDPIFVGDGDGDSGFEDEIRRRKKGIIIALDGSHDLTPEVPEFIHKADVHLTGPAEYIQALNCAMGMK
jgi:hypothetical protein